jgi:hypothetical protein
VLLERSIAVVAVVAVLGACSARLGDSPRPGEVTAPDASAEVEGLPDARDSDAATPPDAAPMLTPAQRCQARYGAVPEFYICTTTDTSCTFIAANGNVSCEARCASYGGTCLRAEDNDVGKCTLEKNSAATCQTTGKTDLLCTCTLP